MSFLRDFTGMLLAKEMRVATTFLSLTMLSAIASLSCLAAAYTEPTFFSQGIALSWGLGIFGALSLVATGIALDYAFDRS